MKYLKFTLVIIITIIVALPTRGAVSIPNLTSTEFERYDAMTKKFLQDGYMTQTVYNKTYGIVSTASNVSMLDQKPKYKFYYQDNQPYSSNLTTCTTQKTTTLPPVSSSKTETINGVPVTTTTKTVTTVTTDTFNTIKQSGCALTSYSTMLSFYKIVKDPGVLNQELNKDACLFNWEKANLKYGVKTLVYQSFPTKTGVARHQLFDMLIKGIVRNNYPIILRFKNASGATHFATVTGISNMDTTLETINVFDPVSTSTYKTTADFEKRGWVIDRVQAFRR